MLVCCIIITDILEKYFLNITPELPDKWLWRAVENITTYPGELISSISWMGNLLQWKMEFIGKHL